MEIALKKPINTTKIEPILNHVFVNLKCDFQLHEENEYMVIKCSKEPENEEEQLDMIEAFWFINGGLFALGYPVKVEHAQS